MRVLFGHDWMGGWTRHRGRFARLRTMLNNGEATLFRTTWIVGRDRYAAEALDLRDVEIVIDRWPGDRYPAEQKIERATWRNRFRTKVRYSYWWNIPSGTRGIPTDPKGKWGDDYQETTGFGAPAEEADTATLIANAPAALVAELPRLLERWPAGLVPADRIPSR